MVGAVQYVPLNAASFLRPSILRKKCLILENASFSDARVLNQALFAVNMRLNFKKTRTIFVRRARRRHNRRLPQVSHLPRPWGELYKRASAFKGPREEESLSFPPSSRRRARSDYFGRIPSRARRRGDITNRGETVRVKTVHRRNNATVETNNKWQTNKHI